MLKGNDLAIVRSSSILWLSHSVCVSDRPMEARHSGPREGELSPEQEARIISLSNATMTSARLSAEQLKQYEGKYIGLSPDGRSIVGSADTREILWKELEATFGSDANNCATLHIPKGETVPSFTDL